MSPGLSCYLRQQHTVFWQNRFQCPLGLIPHFYRRSSSVYQQVGSECQCPLGLIHHFYTMVRPISLRLANLCQCPLGLIPHFYTVAISRLYSTLSRVSMPSQAYTSFLLIAGFDHFREHVSGVNALSGLYIISTVPLQKPRFYAVSRACFCRYLSEYSDNSRFFVHVNILDIFNEMYLPLTLD